MSQMNLPIPTLALSVLLLFQLSAKAEIILYVDRDAAPGGDGFSWETAFDDLAEPLDLATFGITFRIAEGTYTPDRGTGDRDATFQLKSAIVLEGGYAGISEPDPNVRDIELYETILSGDLLGDDGPDFANYEDNSYHVVNGTFADETGVLNGFTISGGNANGSKSPRSLGGGMYIGLGLPTIGNCTFAENTAQFNGGAIYARPDGILTLTECRIIHNTSAQSGGGIYAHSSTIGEFGLAVYNVEFLGNSANSSGGALFQHGATSMLFNAVFSGNSAAAQGGAISTDNPQSVTAINCTFAGNSAASGRALYGDDLLLNNCILWNGGNEVDGTATVTYSNIQFGWPGEGNIFAIPAFADPLGPDGLPGTEDDDLRLLPGSPCIDAADNTSVPPDEADLDGDGDTAERTPLDLDGNSRFVDDPATEDSGVPDPPDYPEVVDMGAYEFQVACVDPNDCDGDGMPNGTDNCPDIANPEQADFDEDGIGDVCDDDIDDDGVLNEDDVCDFTPPGADVQPNGTLRSDADGDCDVDLYDFAILQLEFTGAY